MLRYIRLQKVRSIRLWLRGEKEKQRLLFLTRLGPKDESLKSFREELKRRTGIDYLILDDYEIEILHLIWKIIFAGSEDFDIITKNSILQRDNHRCRYCGSENDLQIHHIVPRALHGKSDPQNLATACKTCNDLIGGTIQIPPGWVIRIDERTSF